MARGGRRVGAGRKPGAKKGVVIGLDGARMSQEAVSERLPPAVADVPASAEGLLEPPADLQEDEKAPWRRFAPFAVKEQTLTEATAVGFGRLCKQWAYCAALDARIRVLGIASGEADSLLKRLEKWEQRLDASLGNFKLRSFGKPATAEKAKQPVVNPWAAVAAK